MKGYVIKDVCVAPENHPTRAGEVLEFILIKGGYVRYTYDGLFQYDCYKTKCIAQRYANQLNKKQPIDGWNHSYTVMEVK